MACPNPTNIGDCTVAMPPLPNVPSTVPLELTRAIPDVVLVRVAATRSFPSS